MKLIQPPSPTDIIAASDLIHPYIETTPLLHSESLNHLSGSRLFFKCENFQKAGAFKTRGATHALLCLDKKEYSRGAVTHSSGNHAQALARAARIFGIPAYIVMPQNAPKVKVEAVKAYGGKITFCKPTLADREETADNIVRQTGATLVHPYNNYDIIAGQATVCHEMLQQGIRPDFVLCPVGGGGLLSGTLLAVHHFSPHTKTIACEPEGANDTLQSMQQGQWVPVKNPETIADGLRTSLGTLTWPIIKQYVHQVVTVSDCEIIQAMRLVWERMKIIIEPSAAVPVAVALKRLPALKDKIVAVIISGGNTNLEQLPWQ